MRQTTTALLIALFGLLLLSCDKDLLSSADQPQVDYVLLVTDSAKTTPLDSVKIRVTTLLGDTTFYTTDPLEGRVELPTLSSSRTRFYLTRIGYRTLDLIDTVNAKPDTFFNLPLQRTLQLKMVRIGAAPERPQVILSLQNEDLEKLRRGRASFTDSTGTDLTVTDADSNGTIVLSGLKTGPNRVLVEQPSYLGRYFTVDVAKVPENETPPNRTVVLLPRNHKISGEIRYKVAGESKPLTDARVKFVLKDSLASPKSFQSFTDPDAAKGGFFQISDLPALEGDLFVYKNRSTEEHSYTVHLTREEVMRDGPLAPITLTISQDTLINPVVDSLPSDSLSPTDTLAFRFNQPVDRVVDITVQLINGSPALLSQPQWNKDRTSLKIMQKDAPWLRGKKYEYRLSLLNAQGDVFTRRGDSGRVISGTYFVRDSIVKVDSSLRYPMEFDFAYFNSGGQGIFGLGDSTSSPGADSTSQFAVLKWQWSQGNGRRVDSLLLFYKDDVTAVNSNWMAWGSVPGFRDSAILNFSDRYATALDKNSKPDFPLLRGGKLFFKIIPKHQGIRLDDKEINLASIEQEMGPSVYVRYTGRAGLKVGQNELDSIQVSFLLRNGDPSSAFDWVVNPPTPRRYLNGQEGVTNPNWHWTDSKNGQLIYQLGGIVPAEIKVRADLNGQMWKGRPIWQRNGKKDFSIR